MEREQRPDRADLEHRILWYVRVLGVAMSETHRILAERLHVNGTQMRAMDRLFRRGDHTAGQLSRALRLTTGATTAMVDGIVEIGHAERLADPTDRRRAVIRATETAQTTTRDLQAPLRTALFRVLSRYEGRDLEVLARFLSELYDEVREHNERLTDR